ncbi:MAG: AbrB/MazE/SpoVT family DNA-binding domain-containing protein [Desulfobacteraceae bacterium]|nr:AbrB/MazE/SpoVT family DNA-binding domain-containing protein [Desulfobacteraceae bacterium]
MTTLIRIGNSQGVRIPKAIIEQAKLEGQELVFKISDEGLTIQPVQKPRQGWKKEFDKILKIKEADPIDQEWLDAPLTNNGEWEW